MSMLPRLKPRCFYDIVIEVAIVRPGPIQGNMVHPYLRRRNGLERPYYPDSRVERILGKTLGVPIFQEQAMRLAITLANFSPGEAEKLRRAMAAWKTHKGVIEAFKEKITRGMLANGYTEEFADTCLNQIKGFSEYGFPESHAASFALLVYASAWIKRHYPAEFACALLNSQPMGFYAPAQIVRDAQRHGVSAVPIDANKSGWNCSVEHSGESRPTLRLGLRLVTGLREESASRLQHSVERDGEFSSVSELWGRNVGASKAALTRLAHADAFGSVSLNRRPAHWEIQELPAAPAPLDAFLSPRTGSRAAGSSARLPESTLQREMFTDYATTGLSLRAHPLQFLRPHLDTLGACTAEQLSPKHGLRPGSRASAAGLAIIRQRPGTAKGVVFLTLEDETGSFNVIVRPALFEQKHRTVMMAAVLLVSGKLERVGEIAYIDANSVEPLDGQMAQVRSSGIPSRSYSY
jgi:error-prone DNA polymerase